ncbi:hypothetical protein KP509_28G009600 [Ceratopteris richardii]|uniref:non-specific serine/threonine protein kinase n=1 Tax=Ceratopteris richardii TaxID=49495 RepID=A0A8T2RB75_CERRI|nr:hypothetical protein KP509_28G009600 [Ceratopteris richardii]
MQKLYLYKNELNGSIPREFGNYTYALEIDLSENKMTGNIPPELGRLEQLQLLHLFENFFTGSIPSDLGNLSNIQQLDFSINNLTDGIPTSLQYLSKLKDIRLFDNNLHGPLPPLLGKYSNLTVLDASVNMLSGNIPNTICENQQLTLLNLWSNNFSGKIPDSIKNCSSLTQLGLEQNKLNGTIPAEIGNCKNLQGLLLSNNQLSGRLPPELGNLSKLAILRVSGNSLQGDIPLSLMNCTKLLQLDLSKNLFTGSIPSELGRLTNLMELVLEGNHLTGTIPLTLANLTRLTELQLGDNALSGQIPPELGAMRSLQIALNLSCNNLSGEIPADLQKLSLLEYVHIEKNKLSGEIPAKFASWTSLVVFNVSYNGLVGAVPSSPTFEKMDVTNFVGNDGLCGKPLPTSCATNHSFTDERDNSSNQHRFNLSAGTIILVISALIGGTVIMAIIASWWYTKPWYTKPSTQEFVDVDKEESRRLSGSDHSFFPKPGFTFQSIVDATDNFAESSVLGRGACGTVYKAKIPGGNTFAVKLLKSDGDISSNLYNSFDTELSTLGKISHGNIVRLYGYCYHQKANLLLYEYMPRGSLGEHLHSEVCKLDWNLRYEIALGAAQGLTYLHHDCKPQIIHRDIKSNNILLDENFKAHVGDFGLAKNIDVPHSKSVSAIVGSYGYIAPEYAYSMKVTEKSDIYSFGVVLLELLTGKMAVQPIEQGGNLVTCIWQSIRSEGNLMQMLDARLDLTNPTTVTEMTSVMRIALMCSRQSPFQRPSMRDVVVMLTEVRMKPLIRNPMERILELDSTTSESDASEEDSDN